MEWLLRNFWLKIVAFGLAFLVWVHVATEKSYNYEFQLPVTEIVLGEDLALALTPPDSVLISVSATGKQLLRRKWRQEGVRINAAQYPAGRFTLSLSAQNSSLVHPTTEVQLDEVIAPTSMRLEIDSEASREVPVIPQVEAIPDEGFAAGHEIVVEPAMVTVTGPRTRLQAINELKTESRRLGSLRNPVTVLLPLQMPEGYGFGLEPESVLVTVPVYPVKTTVFEDVPVMVFNAPTGPPTLTDPATVRLEITGSPDDIDELSRNVLSVSVDFREKSTSNRCAVKVDCPPNFRLKSLSADSVRILDLSDADSRN